MTLLRVVDPYIDRMLLVSFLIDSRAPESVEQSIVLHICKDKATDILSMLLYTVQVYPKHQPWLHIVKSINNQKYRLRDL